MQKFYLSTSLCRKNGNSNCLKLSVNNVKNRATIGGTFFYPMCFSFWGVPRGDSRLTNQSETWLVNLRGVSIFPGKTPKAKTHSVYAHKG